MGELLFGAALLSGPFAAILAIWGVVMLVKIMKRQRMQIQLLEEIRDTNNHA